MEKDALFPEPSLHISRIPHQTRSPYKTESRPFLKIPGVLASPPDTPTEQVWRKMLCFQSQWFIYLFIHLFLPLRVAI